MSSKKSGGGKPHQQQHKQPTVPVGATRKGNLTKSDLTGSNFIPGLDFIDYVSDGSAVAKYNAAKDKLRDYVGPEMGHNSHIFDNLEDYVFQEPDMPEPDALSPENDRFGFAKKKYEREIDSYVKRQQLYLDNKSRVFSIIWRQCTLAMRHRIQQYSGYDDFKADQDPLRLWGAITEICIGDITNKANEVRRKVEAKRRFARVAQFSHESIGMFYERFKAEYDALVAAKGELVHLGQAPPEGEPEARKKFFQDAEAEIFGK